MADVRELTIHEWHEADGARRTVRLAERDGALAVQVGDAPPVLLAMAVLERVMRRYGKPLADEVALDGARLDLSDASSLTLLRHRARYDVIARDFLVWTPPTGEPLAELAVAISGALVHLARVGGVRAEEASADGGASAQPIERKV